MGKLKPAALFCIVFMFLLALFPLACPVAATSGQSAPARHSMPGATDGGMCARMQNQQTSRPVPSNSAASETMPPTTGPFFRCEIMSSLQNTQVVFRRHLSGIRRILRDNVCENKNRKAIYDLILEHSGIDHAELLTRTGLNKETLRYHLAILTTTHKISAVRDGGTFYYFENNGAFAIPEQKIVIHMRSNPARMILENIEQNPGIHQAEIADILRVTPPAIIWHIRKLKRDGFVQEGRRGKTICYILTQYGEQALAKFRNRSSAITTGIPDPATHAG
jgi:predicted transcriptional regulator